MSKESIIQRNIKRQKLVKKYEQKRKNLKILLTTSKLLNEKFEIQALLEKLPKDSAKVRLRNRCWKTGKARGFFRYFGLSRNILREFSHQGFLPGVIKSSW